MIFNQSPWPKYIYLVSRMIFLIQVFEEIGPITTPGSQAKHLISCIVPIIIQTKIRLFQLWTFDYNMIFLIHT
jgi:hypothetical protein